MKKIVLMGLEMVLLAGPASAIQVDFTKPILGADKKPQMECKEMGEANKCLRTGPVTLGEIASVAVGQPDKTISSDEQTKRGKLSQDVVEAKSFELTAEQVKLIKDQVAKMGLSMQWVYQVVKAVDPAAAK